MIHKKITGDGDNFRVISNDGTNDLDSLIILYDSAGRPILSTHAYTLGDTTATFSSEYRYDDQLNKMLEIRSWSDLSAGSNSLECSLYRNGQPLNCKSISNDGVEHISKYRYDRHGIIRRFVIRKGFWVMRRRVNRHRLHPELQGNPHLEFK